MRRTKVVCTIGPASRDRVSELVRAGMNVARINFSHGTVADHEHAVRAVREASDDAGWPVGILADLPGPKVRLGPLDGGSARLEAGSPFCLRKQMIPGDLGGAAVSYPGLIDDLRPGDRVLLSDGAVTLQVVACGPDELQTVVVHGGIIRSRAGVNVPSERLTLPAVTPADLEALKVATELGVDMVAQSFVREARDIDELRDAAGDSSLSIIAKIETQLAVRNFDEICARADGVMIARGDLGVEIAFEQVPLIQKRLLHAAHEANVQTIVATQMLESMINSPRPTRAEASDAANAVLDGTDAIMLSAETAIGSYPVEAVRAACRIAEAAESGDTPGGWQDRRAPSQSDPEDIARAAAALIRGQRRAMAVACFTRTGRTAGLLSGIHPSVPVFVYSPDPTVVRRLTLRYAVVPHLCGTPQNTEAMVALMDERLQADHGLPQGALVLLVGSTPVGRANTNFLKVHRLGSQ